MPENNDPNFLSEIATAEFELGISIRLKTMIEHDRPGPSLEFLVTPERATELAHGILEAVEAWKKKYRMN